MVQDKKQFQSGKKSMSQDLDRKAGAADRTDRSSSDTSRQGKQTDLKDKSNVSKRDIGSRK